MADKPQKHNSAPNITVVVACLVTIVALAGIDAASASFTVDKTVYAIIAGILFGVGGIRDIFTGGKDK